MISMLTLAPAAKISEMATPVQMAVMVGALTRRRHAGWP